MARILKVFLVAVFSIASLLFLCLFVLRYFNPPRTALMLQRGGEVRQRWVMLSGISGNLRRMVVISEDASFYQHRGVDFGEIKKSFQKNIQKKKYARGGSTITMQLARNIFLSPDKSLLRKGVEVLIACSMEWILSKERILEIYLNVVEWGKGIYGAEAAAWYYFHVAASDLAPDQAAFLVAILPNPRKWGRWPPGSHVQRRQQIILARSGMAPRMETEPENEIPELPDEEVLDSP